MLWKNWTLLVTMLMPITTSAVVNTNIASDANAINQPANQTQNRCVELYNQSAYSKALPFCSAQANENDVDAQYLLGYMAQEGLGMPSNYYQAINWYQKAAAQNHPAASLALGTAYSTGIYLPIDYKKSFQFFSRAAKQTIPEAQFLLAISYQIGLGTPMNYERAAYWFNEASANGYVLAEELNNQTPKNSQAAPLAENKLPGHEFYTRAMQIADTKEKIRIDLLEQAAYQSHSLAQYQLGLHYFHGLGVPQDDAKAHDWFSKAAHSDYAPAHSYLAWMNAIGLGVEKNIDDASSYFYQAQQKYQPLQVTKRNNAVTTKNKTNNADKSQQSAQIKVSQAPTDPKKALKWYQEAAQKGDITAQSYLGELYQTGKSVPQNFVEAYAWLNLATSNGSQKALVTRDRLAQKMTDSQIAKAQTRSTQLYQGQLNQVAQ